MHKYFALSLLPTLLLGCASLPPLDDGLTPFNGRPINQLFAVIGFPDEITLVDDEVVHLYRIERNHVGLVTEAEKATGLEGQDPLIAKTMMQPTKVDVECEIIITTDKQKRIKTWEYNEAYEGCRPYREKLADFLKI